MIRSLLILLFVAGLALVSVAPPLAAQKNKEKRNAPGNCPWCHGDPERMKAAGIVNHGGFEFVGDMDTAGVDHHFGGRDLFWIESQHYQLGLLLGPQKVGTAESKKIRAELTRLAQALPDVDPKTRVLDPFLRTHLYAQRMEDLWKRFTEVMQVEDADFPDGKSVWLLGTPYMGEGPYLGQKGKFELLVLPTASDQVSIAQPQFGLSIRRTQRWNVVPRDTLIVLTNLAENDLYEDEQIHGHVVFNMTINMLDAYKHYSYDTPCWIREGLAHFIERELNPRYNTFDTSEGANDKRVNKENWDVEVKQLVALDKAPRLAEMIGLRTYAEFEQRHHYACWSMTRFLIEQHAKGYAGLNGALHGRKAADGSPDAEDLVSVHRKAFQECVGLTYAQFDEAWRAWAMTQ